MNYIKCERGHYYDADIYPICPQCSGAAVWPVGGTVTVDETPKRPVKKTETLRKEPSDTGKTDAYWDLTVGEIEPGFSPIVGWLVCTNGKNRGQAYDLKPGQNFIGREETMDVCIANEKSVSRFKHADVIYEPVENKFMALIGESSSLYYVNGNVVTAPVTLKKNDRLKIGEVELMLIPCCDEGFTWGNSGDK